MAQKERSNGNWSERSQAVVLREEELKRQRDGLERSMQRLRAEIAELEKQRDNAAERAVAGDGWASASLGPRVTELREKNDVLDAWADQLDRLEKEINACNLDPDAAAERRKMQDSLAASAEERLALDREIDVQLAGLRDLLTQRAERTGRMEVLAKDLELRLDLDEDRFDNLLASLPAQMARQSQAWTDRLLGRQKLPVRAVARQRLVLEETLAHNGVYNLGDTVELTQEQCEELHRTDRPDPKSGEPWRCRPQSVFTVEEYERAQSEAEKHGITVEEVILWQEAERWQQGRENERARILGGRHKPPQISYTPSRRVRARSRIGMNDRQYEADEVFELPTPLDEAAQLIIRGGVEPA